MQVGPHPLKAKLDLTLVVTSRLRKKVYLRTGHIYRGQSSPSVLSDLCRFHPTMNKQRGSLLLPFGHVCASRFLIIPVESNLHEGILYYSCRVKSAQRKYLLFPPSHVCTKEFFTIHVESHLHKGLLYYSCRITSAQKGFFTISVQSRLHKGIHYHSCRVAAAHMDSLLFPSRQTCTKGFFTIAAQSDRHKGILYYPCRVASSQRESLLFPPS